MAEAVTIARPYAVAVFRLAKEKKKFAEQTVQFEKRRKQVLEQAKALLERDAAG